MLSKKKLDRALLSVAVQTVIHEARLQEQLAERARKDEAVAAERARMQQIIDEDKAIREELLGVRLNLSSTCEALSKKNLDYLRLKGTVDIRSAMGEYEIELWRESGLSFMVLFNHRLLSLLETNCHMHYPATCFTFVYARMYCRSATTRYLEGSGQGQDDHESTRLEPVSQHEAGAQSLLGCALCTDGRLWVCAVFDLQVKWKDPWRERCSGA